MRISHPDLKGFTLGITFWGILKDDHCGEFQSEHLYKLVNSQGNKNVAVVERSFRGGGC